LLSRLGSSIIFKRLLRAALLAGVFFVSAGIVTYLAVRGRTVEVPDVVGKYEDEAVEALDDLGLRMEVKSRAHHDKRPVNTVSDQSPSAGTIVKTGQIVRVSLSLGSGSPTQSAQK
jgi:beta-lactam-binding protein with PASTA domain